MNYKSQWPGFLLSIMILGFSNSVLGQQTIDAKSRPLVEVPTENVLLVVASQPDCPLQVESAQLLMGIEGRPMVLGGKIRNRGTKPISSFSFALWNSLGGGWVDSWPRKITTELLGPGQALPLNAGSADEIQPLTDDLRQKMKLRGPMRAILVFVVVRVKFVDGTGYSDESTFKALQLYLNSTATK